MDATIDHPAWKIRYRSPNSMSHNATAVNVPLVSSTLAKNATGLHRTRELVHTGLHSQSHFHDNVSR